MKYFLPILVLLLILPTPVCASEIQYPTIPDSASDQMPENTASFSEGIKELIQKTFFTIKPNLQSALKICLTLSASAIAMSILQSFSGGVKFTAEMIGTACISGTLLFNTNAMIHLGTETIREMNDYGKILYPVMTAALAAQGGITTSAALYAGTTAFVSILGTLISQLLLPMTYIFLALSTANGIVEDQFLTRIKTILKAFTGWCLKILLTVFTTYLSVTGVVSGTTDAAALKAVKVTISSVVPVVGSILSEVSESVLISTAMAKNAAGIYGLLAVLALFLEPFLKIAVHYAVLKLTAAFCDLLGPKRMVELIDDYSSAMGMILAMTGSVCLLFLISTICYMKGAG